MKSFLVYAAAALGGLAVASPVQSQRNDTESSLLEKRATSFWYANMNRDAASRGFAPDLDNDYSYPVYVAVDAGDGGALQDAINVADNGNQRPGEWLASEPRVVYLPPGTYEISSTLYMKTDTVLMGDATNPPTIKAASGFNGDTLLNGEDPATKGSGELSFAVALKNLVLDTTAIDGGSSFTALYWGVAQAASLQNVRITMPSAGSSSGHTGIDLGRGSTLGLADVRVERGYIGVHHNGHQQALYKNFYFYQNTIGMQVDSGDTISIIGATCDTVGTCVATGSGNGAWVALIDARSINSGVTFNAAGYPNFMIENLSKDTTSDIVVIRGSTVLASSSHVDTYTYGNTAGGNPIYPDPTTSTNNRPAALAPGGKYPVPTAPTFANLQASDFVNVKDSATNGGRTVKGDHTIDESGVLNEILQMAAKANKPVFFPFGKYRVDSTLVVPAGSRIVGEGWATITGYGSFFGDESNPKPVVQVGQANEVGVAQIQDMRFTVSQVLPGAIIFQVNMAGSRPGDVALWNSLVTVGGTRGADDLTNQCTDASNECKAAFIGIHATTSSSLYLENVWNWVADHITESFSGGSNIAGKGGVLIESTKATWLMGLGSEHWWLYQLNLRNAQNVFVGMLQSETNYDQGDNTKQVVPAPWSADVKGWGDPDFSWCGGGDTRCRMGFANYINGGSNLFTYASASWAFFSGPGYQGCADNGASCQDTMHWIQAAPTNLQAFGLCSKSTYAILREANGQSILEHPSFGGTNWGDGGIIAAYRA